MKRFAIIMTALMLTAALTARAADKPKPVHGVGLVARTALKWAA